MDESDGVPLRVRGPEVRFTEPLDLRLEAPAQDLPVVVIAGMSVVFNALVANVGPEPAPSATVALLDGDSTLVSSVVTLDRMEATHSTLVANARPRLRLVVNGSFDRGEVHVLSANGMIDSPGDMSSLVCTWEVQTPTTNETIVGPCWVAWTSGEVGAHRIRLSVTDNDGDIDSLVHEPNTTARSASDLASGLLLERGFSVLQLQILGIGTTILILRGVQALFIPRRRG